MEPWRWPSPPMRRPDPPGSHHREGNSGSSETRNGDEIHPFHPKPVLKTYKNNQEISSSESPESCMVCGCDIKTNEYPMFITVIAIHGPWWQAKLFFQNNLFHQMDVSKNSGKTPKMDGENHGKPY